MEQLTPKTIDVLFKEESPNFLVPEPRHAATLAQLAGGRQAATALDKARTILQDNPTVYDVAVWADGRNLVRARVEEIGQDS